MDVAKARTADDAVTNRIHMVPVTPDQCRYSIGLQGARTTTEQKKSPRLRSNWTITNEYEHWYH